MHWYEVGTSVSAVHRTAVISAAPRSTPAPGGDETVRRGLPLAGRGADRRSALSDLIPKRRAPTALSISAFALSGRIR